MKSGEKMPWDDVFDLSYYKTCTMKITSHRYKIVDVIK